VTGYPRSPAVLASSWW